MFEEIARRWDRWAGSGSATRALRDWQQQRSALHGWTMTELRSPVTSARTDSMQAALVGLAQGGDTEAAATLIIQLRPGLCRLVKWAAGFGHRAGPVQETPAEVLSVFSEVVMQHCLARRPHKIAANLLFDTRQRIWRTAGRESKAAEAAAYAAASTDTGHQGGPGWPEAVTGEIDLVNEVGSAIGRMKGTDQSRRLTAEVAYRAWILDQGNGDIARDLGLGPRAVTTRLCRLRSEIRHGCHHPPRSAAYAPARPEAQAGPRPVVQRQSPADR